LHQPLDAAHPPVAPAPLRVSPRTDLGPFTQAVAAFHDGDVAAIDGIPVRQSSGEFLVHAWAVLREVPPGEPVTYTEFAELAGRPAAVRAAASACARNATALFVPCHRVLRIGGALGGFRWGVDVKRWLLDHEAGAAATSAEAGAAATSAEANAAATSAAARPDAPVALGLAAKPAGALF
jgi:methylated-DNA-[protein]-cysteine S-methyltransferase